MRRTIAVLAALVIVGYLLWPYAFTVVPINAGTGTGGFDAVTFVDEAWDDIVATTRADAVDMATLLPAIAPDKSGIVGKDQLAVVTKTYGLVTAGQAHVFLVKITGTVASVDTGSSVGTMTVAIAGYDGPIAVEVYIGPRIPSDDSSIRDAVGSINFGDFRDQTEYGRVASEINGRVAAMLATLDLSALDGRPVTVYGAMTIRTFNLVQIDVSTLRVVPIAVEVG